MNLLKKSLSILNSSLIFVLVIYILNVIFTRLAYLNREIFGIIFILPLKVFVYGGILGMLVELVSGEEIILHFNRFRINAQKYWKHYLIITGFPLLLYFFIITNDSLNVKLDAFSFFSFIDPLLLYILSTVIVQNKYINPLKLKKQKIPFPVFSLVIMFGLFLFGLFIFHLPYIISIPHFELPRITKFIYLYNKLLIFIFFTHLIINQYPDIREKYAHKKEIYLINPLGGGLIFHLSSVLLRIYPAVFVVIKALTPKNYKFREFNRVFWKQRYYASDKLVAITCFTSNCMDAYRIAREFKKYGSTVIMGGPHVTFLPDEALEYCDSIVCGELENVWQQIIEDYEKGILQKKYEGVPVENCHHLIHQELLNSPPAVIKDFLETSRGCKFHCYFCAVPSLSQGKLRKKQIPEFIELLKKVRTKYKNVAFIDNNIYSDPSYTKELFQAIKPVGLNWSTQCTVDIAKNDEMLKLAKDSGCASFLIGFEISEGSFEKGQGGKLAMADHYREYARKIKKIGIRIKAHYIFGFESDTFKYLIKFWKFCFAINPFATVLSILTPYPGTRFYYDMVKQDRIANLNWRHYGGQTLVFRHPRMNNFFLSKLYPIIFVSFLFTTSKLGYILLFLAILNILGII